MREVEHLIVGAGPAGLVLQRFLREPDTVLLDPSPFGYKIGESIIPEHFGHPLLAELLPALRAQPSYSPKYGTIFVADGCAASFPLSPGTIFQ